MIVKFKKTPGRFITIDRTPIDEDATISFKAKGILTYLMGRPDDWKPRIEEIAKHSCEKTASVRTGVKELQKAGYIELRRIKDEKNRWVGWEWRVTDTLLQTPIDYPKCENQLSEESPKCENRVSGKVPNNEGETEIPEMRFSALRENAFVNNKEINNIDQEIKRREREGQEKTARANSPQVEIYREIFGDSNFKRLTILQQQQLTMLNDLALLRKTCEWWAGNGYQAKSIGSICERYHEQQQRQQEKSKPRQSQQESTFDHNLRMLGIDPASLQSIQ